MSESAMTGVPVEIKVELSANDVSETARNALATTLEDYTRRLLDGLGVPVIPGVQVDSSVDQSVGASAFRMWIGGKECRTVMDGEVWGTSGPDDLELLLQRSLVDNRRHFLTEPVVREIRASDGWNCPEIEVLSEDEQTRLMETYLDRCFKIGFRKGEPDGDGVHAGQPLEAFDTLVGDVRAPDVAVLYNLELNDSDADLARLSKTMRDELYYELGVVFPTVKWELDSRLRADEFQIKLNDLLLPTVRGLGRREYLVNDNLDRLRLLDVQGRSAVNPGNGMQCAVVGKHDAEVCETAGLKTWDTCEYMILHLTAQLRNNAGSVLTRGFVRHHLRKLRTAYPKLVDTALRRFSIHKMTWILRDLLDEGLSIGDLVGILNALVLINGTVRDDLSAYIVFFPGGVHLVPSSLHGRRQAELQPGDFANYVRMAALRRYISRKYTRGKKMLMVYLLDSKIEMRLRQAVSSPLTSDERRTLVAAIRDEADNLVPGARMPVILTTGDIRRQLQRLLSIEFPRLAVLSYDELSPEIDINIQPIARISLAGKADGTIAGPGGKSADCEPVDEPHTSGEPEP